MKRTQPGPPIAWIWAGVAIIAVLLISVLFWALSVRPTTEAPSTARVVPDVSGMTFERAEESLAALDLVAVEQSESSADVTEGNVIRTEPAAETSVNPGQEVDVFSRDSVRMRPCRRSRTPVSPWAR